MKERFSGGTAQKKGAPRRDDAQSTPSGSGLARRWIVDDSGSIRVCQKANRC